MTSEFSAAAHLSRLKDFQRRTVRHVVSRLYDDAVPTRRFLVADETGLGKSVVARGVVAEAIERLLDKADVERIDIVYVCSNADIAAQNLSRLNVVGNHRVEFRTRLTMLATQTGDLSRSNGELGKPVNLIAFTPGTSFDSGWRTGRSEERALLAVLLEQILCLDASQRTALHRVLQGPVRSLAAFQRTVDTQARAALDSTIVEQFAQAVRTCRLDDDVEALLADVGRRWSLDANQQESARALTGTLRSLLAQASVHALEPDLVILDEFQRFRHLIDPENGSDAAELARRLVDWGDARTLLLSATPYKPFTLAEEDAAGEDHYTDFMATLKFLCSDDADWLGSVRELFEVYRATLMSGADSTRSATDLREHLLQFMCRTERPTVAGAHREVITVANDLNATDFVDYVGLRNLAEAVGGQVRIEYWKSTPYFTNFIDGYQAGERLKTMLRDNAVPAEARAALQTVNRLNPDALEKFAHINMGNARLRALAERTIGAGWWRLLWIPPSMPYFAPGGPFAEPFARTVTKQLIFSSWAATPTAIAGLLSYDVDRRVAEGTERLLRNTADARQRLARPLTYRATERRAGAMSTLALFWPHPVLAAATDPLQFARESTQDRPAEHAHDWAYRKLGGIGEPQAVDHPYTDFFSWPGALPDGLVEYDAHALSRLIHHESSPTHEGQDEGAPTRLDLHIEEARKGPQVQRPSASLAELAIDGPGCIAWRALSRLVSDSDAVTEEGLWAAAASLANDLRSLFNRVESVLLLDQLYPGKAYWRAVLAYCHDGNLQATLDEYLHHTRSSLGEQTLDDASLVELSKNAGAVLSMRPSRYQALDPDTGKSIPLNARFALRYGSARAQDDDKRLPEVRAAFNSPFWPFILASTSSGQEGVDFHWWCHSVVHWNTPASPIDFEQREGRVNRFGGHAVRKNVAASHRDDVMRSSGKDPWKIAYDAAARSSADTHGDFSPYWIYPGEHAVERHLFPYPLSKDGPRSEALKRDLTLYRLALGQPRQEDFVNLLKGRGVTSARPIDLTPPRS